MSGALRGDSLVTVKALDSYDAARLLRGTRAVPTMVGIVLLALLYWLAVAQDLATLEFVLRSAVLYIGVAIIVVALAALVVLGAAAGAAGRNCW